MRPVEFLEQRAAGDAEAADRPLLVELPQKLADCPIEFGQVVEAAMALSRSRPPKPIIVNYPVWSKK